MKICWIEPHFLRVGGIRRVVEFSNHLVWKGHNVTVLCPDVVEHTWDFKGTLNSFRSIGTEEFDVAICNFPELHTEFDRIPAKLKVYYCMSYEPSYRNSPVLDAYKKPYLFLANSKWTANKVKKHIGRDLPIVYGGINIDHFHPDMSVQKDFDVIYYRSPRPWKRSWEIESRLSRYLKLSNLDGGVNDNEIARKYSEAKIAISASVSEGWNWIGIEAMACGLPVVIMRDGGSDDYIENGVNGYCIEAGDWNSFVKNTVLLCSNSSLRTRMSKAALKTAEKFSWETATDTLISILETTLKRV